MMQHKHIQVFGTVQGAGFRHHTELIAKKLDIFGTVQNVEDYVDIYAQGDEEKIKSFINKVIEDILLFECVMGVIVISKDVDAVRGIANRGPMVK